MKKILLLVLVSTFCLIAIGQCKISNIITKKIVTDYYTKGTITGSICLITISKKVDTTFYEVRSIQSLSILNHVKLTDYLFYKGSYILIEKLNCKTYESVVENQNLYKKLKRYCIDDVTTVVDEKGYLITQMEVFDPSSFLWIEVKGNLISKIVLCP